MSRKGNCWDNAVIERLLLNLTIERVWQRDHANHAEATSDIASDIAKGIVSFHNSARRHSKLGHSPPNAFEHESAIKQAVSVCETA
jgi:putative transposase